jgi:uncharacterized membrane protein
MNMDFDTLEKMLDDKTAVHMPRMKRLGMEQKHAAALAYLLGPITGLFFYACSVPGERLVRHHALQSIALNLLFLVIIAALWFWMWLISLVVPLLWLFSIIYIVVLALYFLVELVCAIAGWNEKELTLPIVGGVAKSFRGPSFEEMEQKA